MTMLAGPRTDPEVQRQIEQRWSFPEVLAHRKTALRTAWYELARSQPWQTVTVRPSGAGPTRWIHLDPPPAAVSYPVVLDIVERCMPLLSFGASFWEALAPRWETLVHLGAGDPASSRPRWDDVPGGEQAAIRAFSLGLAARAVASLGAGWGLVARGVDRYDLASSQFVARLRREASLTGFRIVTTAGAVPGNISAERDREQASRHAFDGLPPGGWGYLRRGHLALVASGRRLREQHTPYLLGMTCLGPEFVYRQCAGLAAAVAGPDRGWAAILAGRAAEDLGNHTLALMHFEEAAASTSDDPTQAMIAYEAATAAIKLGEAAYETARTWCQRGETVAARVPPDEGQAFLRIRLCNVQALLAYRQGRHRMALAKEIRALRLAKASAVDSPAHRRVAFIRANLARVLQAMGRLDVAVAVLERNFDVSEDALRRNSRIDVARIAHDRGQYAQVVTVLRPLHESSDDPPASFNESWDAFGLLLLVIASIQQGDDDLAVTLTNRLERLRAVVALPS